MIQACHFERSLAPAKAGGEICLTQRVREKCLLAGTNTDAGIYIVRMLVPSGVEGAHATLHFCAVAPDPSPSVVAFEGSSRYGSRSG